MHRSPHFTGLPVIMTALAFCIYRDRNLFVSQPLFTLRDYRLLCFLYWLLCFLYGLPVIMTALAFCIYKIRSVFQSLLMDCRLVTGGIIIRVKRKLTSPSVYKST